ncbi:MAG: hypothetical protein ACYDCK_10265 [Thermoplasmatota archaeon]
MARLRLALLFAAIAPLALVTAAAQPPSGPLPSWFAYSAGGTPGVHFYLNGRDAGSADQSSKAIPLDPGRPLNLSVWVAPPNGTIWSLRSVRVAVLLTGPGSSGLSEERPFNASVPGGYTVYLNQSVDVGSAKNLGAGIFLVRTSVVAVNGTDVGVDTFYVHLMGNVLLSASGAIASAATVATGYGLWQIVRDVKEFHDARERHKKEEEEKAAAEALAAKQVGKGIDYAKVALNITGGVSGLVNLAGDKHKEAAELGKRAPIAWCATGLGLGAVGLTWAQFFGYLPVNVGQTLVTAATFGTIFLTLSLIAVAFYRRAQRKKNVTRTGPPKTPPRAPTRPAPHGAPGHGGARPASGKSGNGQEAPASSDFEIVRSKPKSGR